MLDLLKHADTLPQEQKQRQLKHILHLTQMIDTIMSGPTEASEKTDFEPLKELRKMIDAQKEQIQHNNTINEKLMRRIKLKYAKKKLQEYKWN